MVMKSDSARTKPVEKRVITMMRTIISAASPSVSGLPNAGVLSPVATLMPIFMRPVPISRMVAGDDRREEAVQLADERAPGELDQAADHQRGHRRGEGELPEMATIGPMKM